MANINELQLQGDSTVHKLNDARITTTAVSTATHLLTTNSGVTSIAPITTADLASVLGDVQYTYIESSSVTNGDLNNLPTGYVTYVNTGSHSLNNMPPLPTDSDVRIYCKKLLNDSNVVQFGGRTEGSSQGISNGYWIRYKVQNQWQSWQRIDNFGCSTPSALASLLGVDWVEKAPLLANNASVVNIANPYVFRTTGGNSYTDSPWNGNENYALYAHFGLDSHHFIFSVSSNSGKFAFRVRYDTNWKDWVKIG